MAAVPVPRNTASTKSQYAPPPPEPKRPLGKKEQLQMEAETAHAGNSWGELLQ